MSEEHLMKHCVDLQALLTDKETDEADTDGLQSKNKCPIIRSAAVHN
jgi:hypothetical protein